MATNFPGAIDTPTNPQGSSSGGTDNLNTPGVIHGYQHQFANDAIVALETKVGANSSTDPTSLDFKVTALENSLSSGYVPYSGATGPVDLGTNSLSAGQLLLNDFSGINPVGSITTDVDNGVNLTHVPSGTNFVGYNAFSSTPYFGSDPTAYGYGVSYGSGILYVTANGGASAQGFQFDGAGVVNGDSSSYTTPLTVNDANTSDDGSTRAFSVYLSGLGREGLSVDNQAGVYMNDASTYFNYSGGGYLAGGVTWNNTAQLRVGGGAPVFAYLEAIGASYSHLRMGENDSIYSQITVDGAGGMTVRPSTNNTGTLKVANSAGTALFTVDTSNDRLIGRLGSNDILFAKGASNITPNISIGASGGKAVALGSGTTGSFFAYDSTGTFAISTDTRANLVGGSSSGGTQRIGMTSAGLVMIGAGTATAQLHVASATAGADLFKIANTDAAAGNTYTFSILNAGTTKALKLVGGGSSNDSIFFNATMTVGLGTNANVGVGTNALTTSAKLHVLATTEQFRRGYDASNYASDTVSSTGSLTIDCTGTNPTIVFGKKIRLKGYTVATLPAGTQGDLAFVTDALAPTFLGALTGGGAIVTKVFYNGTAWVSA